ncbi:MAG: leucine-rich repeat protein [bacterium]|nr:leucine-rich repeat protein [bacterium]
MTIGEHTWKFIVSGEAATITGVTPATGALEIPGVIVVGDNEYTVTGIGDTAFEDSDRLRSVSLPTNLVCIGAYAFADCTALTGMVIPRSVTNVGERAFAGCAGLKSVTVPQCVASDGLWQAFDAEKIVKAVIADGVGSLGAGAFAGCYNLTSVTIPSSVTNMGDSVFEDCSSLKRVVIPRGVARIGKGAFYSCFELESVTIPNSVTKIADDAFSGCLSLTRVTIPAGVTAVGAGAFEECVSLENVTIPSGVEQIGEGAFWGCSGLARVTISQNFCNRDAWSAAFDTMLAADVVIADGTVEIGDSTFEGYEYITHVSIPESVERIGGRAFYGCASLSDVSFAEAVRADPHGDGVVGGVRCIGDSAFEGCAALKSARLPSCVTNIGGQAFAGCGGLKDLVLPKCVFDRGLERVFGEYQWSGERPCPWETVEVGEGVAEIGDGAFGWLPNLRSVVLPRSVARIGEDAFWNCRKLESVTIREDAAWAADPYAPGHYYDDYSRVREVGDRAFEGCERLVRVGIPDGATRIGGSAFNGCVALADVSVPESVERIGGRAFYGCASLSDVSFAEAVRADPHGDGVVGGVRCIGDSAFEGCAALKSARLPSCVTNIGGQAFAGCGGLKDLVLPKCVFDRGLERVFGEYQWSGERPCPWETVEVGEGVAEIGDDAFALLPELRRVSLPCSVARIGRYAFCRCPRLEVVAVRKGVAPVGYGGVREVGDFAFEGCGGLVRVDVPGGVARIGVSAFQSCGELRNIVFEGDAPRVDGGAFEGVVSSCMVWVKRGSTGWGVAIPGRWQGLKISYRTYLPFDVSCDENLVATRSDHGVVISSVDGTVLTVNDLATVKIMAEMMDGSLADTTEGYNRVLSTDGTSAVFRLKTPEIGVSADEGDVERDPDDPSGTLVKVSGFKRAATPHTEYGESVGTLPVKTVRGLWYQVSWGADLQNMTQGVKVQATGNTLYLGVIKQTGTSGFYKLSVSGK